MRRNIAVLALIGAGALAGCSGGDEGGGAEPVTYAIELAGGGSATTRQGGYGGGLYLETYQPGGVKLKRDGRAATAFEVPAIRAGVDLGPNGVTISSDVAAAAVANGEADPGAGQLYVVTGLWDARLYKGDGTGTVPDASEVVTGLSIARGATFVLPLNISTGGNPAVDVAYVQFAGDVEIAGTLRVAGLTTVATPDDRWSGDWSSRPATALDAGALSLSAEQVFIRPGGLVDLRGGDAAPGTDADGGNGGYVSLWANTLIVNEGAIDNSGGKGDGSGDGGHAGVSSAWGHYLGLWVDGGQGAMSGGGGMIVNRGPLRSSGGDGAYGGEPSEVQLWANSHVFNTGAITASGGHGSAGPGGDAGWDLELGSSYGSVFSSGALTQQGGDGTLGGGGGGYVYLYAGDSGYAGDVVSSGAITTSGGRATVDGDGGYGGEVGIYAYGAIRTSGDLTGRGGDAAGTDRYAGGGGYLELYGYAPYDWMNGYGLPVRPVQVSGNVVLRGGAAPGGFGGEGGELYASQGNSGSSAAIGDAGIELLGYRSADLSGGDGAELGGDGDYFEVYTYPLDHQAWPYAAVTPAGGIENELDVALRGGAAQGAEGTGGQGGFVYLEVADSRGGGDAGTIRSSGAIDTSGGGSKGTSAGGDSGGVELYAAGDVVNHGRIVNRGGDAEAGAGGAGNYYQTWFVAGRDVVNAGAVSTTGGRGASGGHGSDGWEYHTGFYAGGQVRNGAPLESRGGAATDALAGASGAGGHIELFSQTTPTSSVAPLVVAPGDGGLTRGELGEIWIDWVNVTPASGTL